MRLGRWLVIVRPLIVVIVMATHLAAAPVTAVRGESPPDVIVVMVDDLGAIDERILERLPNIKELFLDNGLRFDAAYSETPLCCPSRASFLTGQHTRNHGVYKNEASLLDPSQTIATVLDGVGYRTVLVGKYLNKAALLTDWTPPGWDRTVMLTSGPASINPSYWRIDDVAESAGYHDRFTADMALAELTAAPANAPLFLFVSPFAPHFGPSQKKPWLPAVEPKYVDDERCTGIEPWKPPTYAYTKQPAGFPLDEICRSLLTVDEMVGTLRSAQHGPTVWAFMSDNGMSWGVRGYPLKDVPWAGRFPLYMAGAGVATGSTSALVSSIDVGPTLAELAGTEMPFADGLSFAHLLDGEGQGRDWMLEDHPVGGNAWAWYGVRTPEWHMWQRPGYRPKLYHLPSDPWEMKNVRKKNRPLVKELKALAEPIITQPYK